MGLFEKIFKKAVVPNRIIFENFNENIEMNSERAQLDFDSFAKDTSRILRYPLVANRGEDIYNEKMRMKEDMFALSKHSFFASNMASAVTYAKVYALFYMSTDDGKTEKQVNKTLQQLERLYDDVVCVLLTYFNFVRKERLNYNGKGQFELFANANEESKQIIRVVIEILNSIVALSDAMKIYDNTKVFAAYQRFCGLDVNITVESPFEDF